MTSDRRVRRRAIDKREPMTTPLTRHHHKLSQGPCFPSTLPTLAESTPTPSSNIDSAQVSSMSFMSVKYLRALIHPSSRCCFLLVDITSSFFLTNYACSSHPSHEHARGGYGRCETAVADASQFGDASSQLLGKRGRGMGHNNQHEAVQLLWIAILHLLLCFVVMKLAAVCGGGWA
jgi:hypothetical protein